MMVTKITCLNALVQAFLSLSKYQFQIVTEFHRNSLEELYSSVLIYKYFLLSLLVLRNHFKET